MGLLQWRHTKMTFKLGANSLKNRSGCDKRLIEISDLAISISNIDFGHGPYSGLRTTEDQAKLFTSGVSKCDGRTNKSFHQTGLALDCYAYVDGAASWETEHLALVAVAMLQAASILKYPLSSGVLWNKDGKLYGWDCPHFELKD